MIQRLRSLRQNKHNPVISSILFHPALFPSIQAAGCLTQPAAIQAFVPTRDEQSIKKIRVGDFSFRLNSRPVKPRFCEQEGKVFPRGFDNV